MSEMLVVVALGVIVVAVVAYPLLVGRGRYDDAEALETDIARYREALEADTVCPRCRLANRRGSRYCGECGTALAAAGTPAD